MQKTRTALTPSLIAIVGFLTVCPVAMLILGSLSEGLNTFGQFTLSKYIRAYTDPAFAEILVNTGLFVIGSAAVATLLALFLAYLNVRTNIPCKFLFGVISLIPMMVPHILFAVSWVLLLNPSNGMLNLFLRQVFGVEGAAFSIYTLQGMILVEGLLDLPIAYLVIAPAMSAFDVSLEESSRVCGASNLRTLVRVTLPVLRPAVLAAEDFDPLPADALPDVAVDGLVDRFFGGETGRVVLEFHALGTAILLLRSTENAVQERLARRPPDQLFHPLDLDQVNALKDLQSNRPKPIRRCEGTNTPMPR